MSDGPERIFVMNKPAMPPLIVSQFHADGGCPDPSMMPEIATEYIRLDLHTAEIAARGARIAELEYDLATIRAAIAEKGGTEHAPTEWAYLRACEVIREKAARIAELEAQRDEAIALCKKAQKGHNVALDLAENALTNLRELVAKNAHSMTKTQEAAVKVCPICDIADCHHIRGQNAVNLP